MVEYQDPKVWPGIYSFFFKCFNQYYMLGCPRCPVTVFRLGDPFICHWNPGRRDNPNYMACFVLFCFLFHWNFQIIDHIGCSDYLRIYELFCSQIVTASSLILSESSIWRVLTVHPKRQPKEALSYPLLWPVPRILVAKSLETMISPHQLIHFTMVWGEAILNPIFNMCQGHCSETHKKSPLGIHQKDPSIFANPSSWSKNPIFYPKNNSPSLKITACPWKSMIGRLVFFWRMAYFYKRTCLLRFRFLVGLPILPFFHQVATKM